MSLAESRSAVVILIKTIILVLSYNKIKQCRSDSVKLIVNPKNVTIIAL